MPLLWKHSGQEEWPILGSHGLVSPFSDKGIFLLGVPLLRFPVSFCNEAWYHFSNDGFFPCVRLSSVSSPVFSKLWESWDHAASAHKKSRVFCFKPVSKPISGEGHGAQVLQEVTEGSGVVYPGEKEVWEDLIALYKSLRGGCSQVEVRLLPQATSDRTRRDCLKLLKLRFRLDIIKNSSWRVCQTVEQDAQGCTDCHHPWRYINDM